ncbi:MAG: hypothetical protein KJ914_09465 [Gammaproteobacteria bacterium]|nr:hypothetical protein [Gammaproteobacteria bacterium]MBU1722697.1 hypothetical protein [Gammaproteobacteria bacterium]MBU2006663.1 hypothetical protein [Gammaproteobacteria bacterium]
MLYGEAIPPSGYADVPAKGNPPPYGLPKPRDISPEDHGDIIPPPIGESGEKGEKAEYGDMPLPIMGNLLPPIIGKPLPIMGKPPPLNGLAIDSGERPNGDAPNPSGLLKLLKGLEPPNGEPPFPKPAAHTGDATITPRMLAKSLPVVFICLSS